MRLPPLNALRAFEAAARHGGFIGAADELFVTRGAISRHVKLLEEHLGVALFQRNPAGVTLTEAGRRLQPAIDRAFHHINQEAERIRAFSSDLRVICPPATSIRWLLPRLPDFRERHPDINVRLTTDFHSDGGFEVYEFEIGFSVADWPIRKRDLNVQPLFPVRLTPAAAPNSPWAKLTDPHALAHAPLLHETPQRHDWLDWAKTFAVDLDPTATGDVFPNLDMAVRAAILGSGVVMADLALCQDEFAAGTLVPIFPDMVVDSSFGDICLIGQPETWEMPKVRVFRDWAAGQASSSA